MNEPIYQAWRPIQPVEGEPIPCWTQHKTSRQRKWSSYASDGEVFGPDCHDHEWRVRSPVIPEDIAVGLVLMNSEPIVQGEMDGQFRVEVAGNLEVGTLNQLREMIIAKLRKLSREPATT